jgi:4-azaleucine resistance transporter AzlC
MSDQFGATMSSTRRVRRQGAADGARAVSPLLIGVIPFGLVFGVTAVGTSVGGALGYATSIVIFAGAAQLATVQLLDVGAAALVVIATALIINARHLMYSAALAPHFREFPRWARLALPYLLTDQAFAVSIVRYETTSDPAYKQWFFTGAAATLWIVWQFSTAAGVALGTSIPESWSLDFAIPLVFLALLVPAIKTRPALVAALSGGAIAVLASGAPYGLGLIIGALAGVGAGVLAERRSS